MFRYMYDLGAVDKVKCYGLACECAARAIQLSYLRLTCSRVELTFLMSSDTCSLTSLAYVQVCILSIH